MTPDREAIEAGRAFEKDFAKKVGGELVPGSGSQWYEPLVIDRFIDKILIGVPSNSPDVEGDCWEWTGAKNPRGYGNVGVKGKTFGAHRMSYEIFVGSIPNNLTIDHLCERTSCVNPAHLSLATISENVIRTHRNGTKKVCHRGHPFDEENTLITKNGRRQCRACQNEWHRINRNRPYIEGSGKGTRPCKKNCSCGRHKKRVNRAQ